MFDKKMNTNCMVNYSRNLNNTQVQFMRNNNQGNPVTTPVINQQTNKYGNKHLNKKLWWV